MSWTLKCGWFKCIFIHFLKNCRYFQKVYSRVLIYIFLVGGGMLFFQKIHNEKKLYFVYCGFFHWLSFFLNFIKYNLSWLLSFRDSFKFCILAKWLAHLSCLILVLALACPWFYSGLFFLHFPCCCCFFFSNFNIPLPHWAIYISLTLKKLSPNSFVIFYVQAKELSHLYHCFSFLVFLLNSVWSVAIFITLSDVISSKFPRLPSHFLSSELRNLIIKNDSSLPKLPPSMSYMAHFVASLTPTSLPILAPLCLHPLIGVLPLQSILSTHSTPQSPSSLMLTVITSSIHTKSKLGSHFATPPFPLCTLNQSSSPLDRDHKNRVT